MTAGMVFGKEKGYLRKKVRDEVVHQNDTDFLQFLNNMRNVILEENNVQFVYSRCLDKLSPTKKLLFSNNTIHLVPQWKQTHDIVCQYLQSFNAPGAKIKAIFNSMQTNSGKIVVLERLHYH